MSLRRCWPLPPLRPGGEAKEARPFFPGARRVLHWGSPDRAAIEATEEQRLAAFREVRDGLRDVIVREFGEPS